MVEGGEVKWVKREVRMEGETADADANAKRARFALFVEMLFDEVIVVWLLSVFLLLSLI